MPNILFIDRNYTDTSFEEFMDCLIAHPNVVECLTVYFNKLTNKTGVKISQYLYTSFTIDTLYLSNN